MKQLAKAFIFYYSSHSPPQGRVYIFRRLHHTMEQITLCVAANISKLTFAWLWYSCFSPPVRQRCFLLP